jgi:hypothetical protein
MVFVGLSNMFFRETPLSILAKIKYIIVHYKNSIKASRFFAVVFLIRESRLKTADFLSEICHTK